MSYSPLQNEDSLSELFSEMIDCRMVCENLVKASGDLHSCINWFSKAMQINKRQTLLFVSENKSKFTKEENNYFEQFFSKMNNKIKKEDLY